MREEWKDIKGYEGLYQISNKGRVRSLKKWDVNLRQFVDEERIMSPTDNGHGYLIVSLRKNRNRKNHYVHRLVASAFVDKPLGKDVVNHIDYDRKNNNVKNLEWTTTKENITHSIPRMRHRKIVKTNTGERYIYFRRGRYRICVDKKEYPTAKTLEEAIQRRDEVLQRR